MNRISISNLLLSAVALLLLSGCSVDSPTAPAATAGSAGAKTVDRHDISGQLHIGDDIDRGVVRNPGGRNTIIKGNAFEVELTGGIAAMAVFVQNASYNHRGNGSLNGAVELENAEVLGLTGGLEGQFTGNVKGFWLDANFVLRGRDDLAGCHIRLHLEGMMDSDTFDYSGSVLFDERDGNQVVPDGAVRASR